MSHRHNLFIWVAPFTTYNWSNLKNIPAKKSFPRDHSLRGPGHTSSDPGRSLAITIPQGHDRSAGRAGVVENK